MAGSLQRLWHKLFWPWAPASEREASEAIVRNLWLHWFPAKVSGRSMSWSYSFWLGTAASSLFVILTVTGMMLMFFYVPSTERAYGSIKDLEYAVSFGRLLRSVPQGDDILVLVGAIIRKRLYLALLFQNCAH